MALQEFLYKNDDEDLDEEIELTEEFPKTNILGYPLFDANGNSEISEEERLEMISQLERKFSEVLDILRMSRNDPNSTNTPKRMARMYVNELLAGRFSPPPKLTVFPNRKKVEDLIISKGITVMSLCSHHWQPITGECIIGYIPGDYVLGLSKFNRIVDWFSRRAQIQEELGEQIADYIQNLIKPQALGVIIKAKHYCIIARGVREVEDKALMITSVMRGLMMDDMNLRNEFLRLIDNY
jgi:GTP cyclohydrolase I